MVRLLPPRRLFRPTACVPHEWRCPCGHVYVCVCVRVCQVFEFPCEVLQAPATCVPSFQEFYLVVYWVVCTISTVGYGDMCV